MDLFCLLCEYYIFIFLSRFYYFEGFSEDTEVKLGLLTMTECIYFDRVVRVKIDAQMDRFEVAHDMVGCDMTIATHDTIIR